METLSNLGYIWIKLHQRQYGGFLKWGYPKIEGKSQTKMDDDWGYPYDLGNPHIDEGGYIWILIRQRAEVVLRTLNSGY